MDDTELRGLIRKAQPGAGVSQDDVASGERLHLKHHIFHLLPLTQMEKMDRLDQDREQTRTRRGCNCNTNNDGLKV